MDERFDVELVLREVLDVLRRHNLPVETAALNVSFLDANFDELIPQLRTYKAGHFNRSMVIESTPLLFEAQRRYPFDEIVQVLEYQLRPPVEAFAEALQREYPALNIEFASASATRSPDSPHFRDLHSYRLGILCRFSDDADADFNQLDLSLWLQQHEATAYPRLHATVGWLVDEESGGDWGLDIVWSYNEISRVGDYAPHEVELLRKSLPTAFECLRREIVRKLSGNLANLRYQYGEAGHAGD